MFGMWAIVSAPLVLSFDVTKRNVVDAVWPILSNTEAISINQKWEGSPGRLLLTDRTGTSLPKSNRAGFILYPGQLGQARGWQNVPGDTGPVSWQVGECVDEWTGGACKDHYMVLQIANMTLDKADEWCGKDKLCAGFSYRNGTSSVQHTDDEVREVFFKGANEVFFMDGCGNRPISGDLPPWSSHIKEERAPPFAVSPGSGSVDETNSTAGVQVWVKEFVKSGQLAVLLVNVGQTEVVTYALPLDELPLTLNMTTGTGTGVSTRPGGVSMVEVRDIWARRDLAPVAVEPGGKLLFDVVEPHGSRFLLLTT